MIFLLKNLPVFFVDRTAEIKDFDDAINSYSLPRLRDACNEHLIPNVLCPFGWLERIHNVQFDPWDAIFQRYLPKVILPLLNRDSY